MSCVVSRAEIGRRIAAGRPLGDAMKRYLRCLDRGDPDACAYCGIDLTDTNRTIDHRVSVLRGGRSHIDNLCLACKACNSRKGAMSVAEFCVLIGREQITPPRTPTPAAPHSLGVRSRRPRFVPAMSLMSAESRDALASVHKLESPGPDGAEQVEWRDGQWRPARGDT